VKVLSKVHSDVDWRCLQYRSWFMPSLTSLMPKMKKLWLGALRDYAVLTTQSKASQKVYHAAFFTFPSSEVVINSFKSAYLPILQSTTSLLSTPFWSRSEEDTEVTHVRHFKVISKLFDRTR